MTSDILEKIFSEEKVTQEKVEKKEELKPKVEKVEKPILEEIKKLEEEISVRKINQIKATLAEVEEKIKILQEKIIGLEESLSSMENFKKMRDFSSITQEFYERLNQVEEAKAQIFIQSSKIQTKYFEIVKRFDELEYFLEKMKEFEKISPLIEDLKNFDVEIQLLKESIEKLKLSILEQKFYSLVILIPTIRRKEILINLLDEFDRTIEELKKNNLFRYDKIVLSSEVLESPNVKELKPA